MACNIPNEKISKENEVLLRMLEFYQGQLKGQREVIDWWFGYYLLIIGAPFPILGGLLQIETIRNSIIKNPGAIAIVAFFLFMVGFLFLLMNIWQRINTVRLFFKKIAPIEELLHKEHFPNVSF